MSIYAEARLGEILHTVVLTESGGWKTSDSSTPTQVEILNILGHLTALEIRGEYFSRPDKAYLDNVVLIPEPAMFLLIGLGTLLLCRRRTL
ncbi:MAG: laminin B domain-containing protein [Planctomycetota bacterium]